MVGTAAGTASPSSPHRYSDDDEGPMLYDLVFEKPEAQVQIKTHRDTKNPTKITRERRMGDALTTTKLAFGAPEEHIKPEYARKPIVRDTFYRPTVVLYPGGCSADPA